MSMYVYYKGVHHMTDLERRALLGDIDAQQECTKKGVLLPCPCCGGEPKIKKGFPSRQIAHCRQAVIQCKRCGIRTVTYKQLQFERWEDVDYSALSAWNTRPAPPIGRCWECKNFGHEIYAGKHACTKLQLPYCNPDDFCSYFEPKGGDENAAD